MSSPSLHHASMPSPLPSTHSLASSSPSRSPHLARAQSRIASRHAPPQHRLLLLQPDGLAHRLSSDELVHEIAEARRISHSISSLSLKSKQGRHHIESHHGPLGRYGSQPSPTRRRRRSASQSASSTASSKRLSSSQSMPFYRLDHHEESSPEFSPLFTPPTLRKAPSVRKRAGYHARAASAASYLFPLPPTSGGSGSEGEAEQDEANFEGLGLDLGLNWSTLIDRQEAVESPSDNQHCCYDSDGLTGSQGWSPDTTAFDTGSNMASPYLQASTPVRPLSIRKTSAAVHDDDGGYLEPFDVEDEADAADETEKLARLSQSLSLLSMDAPAEEEDDHDDDQAIRYVDDKEHEVNSAMSPSVVRAIYSPERAAPSLQEQLAFACGNGYQYRGTTPAVGMARVVSSSAEGYLRHPVGSESPAGSESLDPMSGLRAVVGDSWSEAHGCGYDEEDEREGRYDEEEEERRWENVDEEDSFWMRRDSLQQQQQEEDNNVSVVIYDAATASSSAPQTQAYPQARRSSPLQSRRHPFRASLLLPSPTLLSSSPILSGLLSSTPPADSSSSLTDHDALAAAHRQIRVEQLFREPLTSNNITPRSESSAEEFPSRRPSIEVADDEQASAQPSTLPLPQSSPEVAFSLNQEFGSYWSLMETGSPRETHDSSNSKRSPRPPPIALPASPFSPEASFDLSSFKTPEPLDGLPSPQAVDGERPFAFGGAGGERPSIDVTDSRTAIPTSFSMVNTSSTTPAHAHAHPHHSICSAVSMTVTQSQATAATTMTSSTSTSSILDRGRPVPASASAGGFLGRNRDESVRLARAQAVKTLEGGVVKTSPLKEEVKGKGQGPRIPRRTTSMGRLRAAAEKEKERFEAEAEAAKSAADGSGSSEAETIRRVWWQKQQQQQQAASDDEEDNLPTVRPVLSTSASMPLPVALIPGHPAGPEAPSTKRPSISSASGSSASSGSGLSMGSTASSSISVERTRSPRPRALSRGASEALKKELAEMAAKSSSSSQQQPQPQPQPKRRILPGSQSMVSLPVTQQQPRAHLPPPRSTTSLAYIPPAPRKIASMSQDHANYSLPTLFIARTNSQRMRGETGCEETDPRKIAKVAARAARREVSAGILLQSTRRGVPTVKEVGSPMPRQVRWGNVVVARRGSEGSVEGKELPTVPREAPGGVVLVVEETRVSVE